MTEKDGTGPLSGPRLDVSRRCGPVRSRSRNSSRSPVRAKRSSATSGFYRSGRSTPRGKARPPRAQAKTPDRSTARLDDMRTTVTLDERLIAERKACAAEQGISVTALVERAVREFLRTSQPPAESKPFELITFGVGGRFSRRCIDKASALLADDDLVRFRPAGTSSPAE